MSTDSITTDCDPIIYVKDVGDALKNLKNVTLGTNDPAIPCGLVAKSVFTDRYNLSLDGNAVSIDEKGIAWESDIEYKFANMKSGLPSGKDWKDVQWLDMENGKLY